MATRSSSRIKSKPTISYNLVDDEDNSASEPERVVKRGRGRGRRKKDEDDDYAGAGAKKGGKRGKKNGANDENKDKGNVRKSGRKRKARKPSPPSSSEEDENSEDVVSEESEVDEEEDDEEEDQSEEEEKEADKKDAKKDTKKPPAKRGRKPKSTKDVYSDMDEEEEEEDDKGATAKKGSLLGKRKRTGSEEKEETEIADKKEKVKEKIEQKKTSGKILVPVDSYCTRSDCSVYSDENGPWDAMLNQTNVGSNNNKYYLLQLLVTTSGSYFTWYRWGRIGYSTSNNTNLTHYSSLEPAKKDFSKKFADKTKNRWPSTMETFQKYSGKYDLIKLDYSTKEEEEEEKGVEADGQKKEEVKKEEVKKEPVESKLDPRLTALMGLISNVKSMERAVMEMDYDVKKSPLGKLSKEQIKSGYEALTLIEECIKAGQVNSQKAKDACSAFYTRIPHSFGFRQPPMITTLEQVKIKIDLLDMLIDIEAAVKAIKTEIPDIHPSDSFYKNLKIEMTPLEKDSSTFQMLEAYLQNTHAKTHGAYTLTVEDIFELNKEGEEERFTDLGNKQLLWHGSRLTNWGGIFSQGLRIAPPEAPVTGYMFGKGVYFADMASKSANYCFTSRAQPTGILLLCEVALGSERELLNSDYNANKLPAGKHSTKGMGRNIPDPVMTKMLGDVKVPMGTQKTADIGNSSLLYNEYIVYNVAQIKMKYALRVKFNYNR